MIKVGIVGFGLAAKVFHLPIITRIEGFQITCVYSSKAPAEIHKILPKVQVYDSIEVLLDSNEVELVLILTPNDSHFEIAEKALSKNKHVVIDKPFVVSSSEGEKLIALAKNKQRLLSVYHNRRWDGDFLTIKKILAEGKLGRLSYLESRLDKYRPRVWGRWREQNRPGAGLIYDLGSHLIDQSLHLLGTPESVQAKALMQRENAQANDYFDIQLFYNDGQTIVRLRGSSLARVTPFRFYAEGTRGSFIKTEQDVQEQQLVQNMSPFEPGYGIDKAPHYGKWLRMPPDGNIQNKQNDEPVIVPTESGSYQNFYQNLLNAIEHGAELEVSPEQANDVIKVIELAFTSSKQGKEVSFD